MKYILNWNKYNNLNESQQLNESLSDSFKNIINWIRIAGIAKKYQKTIVDKSKFDLDYHKKVEQLRKHKDEDYSKKKEQLDNLLSFKNSIWDEQLKNFLDKIEEYSATDFLKKKGRILILNAQIKANEILLKSASDKETEILKDRIQKDNEKISKLSDDVDEFEKDMNQNIKDNKKEILDEFYDDIADDRTEIKKLKDELTKLQKNEYDASSEKDIQKHFNNISKILQKLQTSYSLIIDKTQEALRTLKKHLDKDEIEELNSTVEKEQENLDDLQELHDKLKEKYDEAMNKL